LGKKKIHDSSKKLGLFAVSVCKGFGPLALKETPGSLSGTPEKNLRNLRDWLTGSYRETGGARGPETQESGLAMPGVGLIKAASQIGVGHSLASGKEKKP
jgi:hypothetical protein